MLHEATDSDWRTLEMAANTKNLIHPEIFREKIDDISLVLVVCEGDKEETEEIESQCFQTNFENIAEYCYIKQKPPIFAIFVNQPTHYPSILEEINREIWSMKTDDDQSKCIAKTQNIIKSLVEIIDSTRLSPIVE